MYFTKHSEGAVGSGERVGCVFKQVDREKIKQYVKEEKVKVTNKKVKVKEDKGQH